MSTLADNAGKGIRVGSGCLGNGFDPHRLDPVAIKEVCRDRQNAFAGRNSFVFSASYDFGCDFHGLGLDMGVTGQYLM